MRSVAIIDSARERSPVDMHLSLFEQAFGVSFEVRIIRMWKTWSLRTRLCIFLCAMFLTALIAGLALLRVFAPDQLADENEPAGRSSVSIAGALNKTLSASPDPEAALEAFVAELNTTGADIKFRRAGTSPQAGP